MVCALLFSRDQQAAQPNGWVSDQLALGPPSVSPDCFAQRSEKRKLAGLTVIAGVLGDRQRLAPILAGAACTHSRYAEHRGVIAILGRTKSRSHPGFCVDKKNFSDKARSFAGPLEKDKKKEFKP